MNGEVTKVTLAVASSTRGGVDIYRIVGSQLIDDVPHLVLRFWKWQRTLPAALPSMEQGQYAVWQRDE